jgi:hypothetical protein
MYNETMFNHILAQGGFPTGPVTTVPDQGLLGFGQLIENIFNYSIYVLGIAVFLMIFAAGFVWLTAGGNAGKIGQAKSMIFNAIIGAILLLSSVIILRTINPDLAGGNTVLPSIPIGGSGFVPIPPGPPGPGTGVCADPGGTIDNLTGDVAASTANVAGTSIGALPNTLPNRRTFIDAVVADLLTRGLQATTNVFNGNDILGSENDLIAVWQIGDTVVERYDILHGGNASETIADNDTVDFTGDIPMDKCINQ